MKTPLRIFGVLLAFALGGTATIRAQDPPPSAPAKRSAADLEKLVASIALYPDPLISIVLPASVYPLEIVQAARFIKDTNNIPKIDDQPWDTNVKSVAKVPAALQKLDGDLPWTSELGEAFVEQPKELMDAIQAMRLKASTAGTLQTNPQQTVIVTNVITLVTNITQVVTVTNQIVQIEPAQTQVVYVPTYNPYTVYYPPPGYVYNPVAPLVTFGVGIAVGAIIANNCDWHYGGVWVGGGHGGHNDIDIDIDRNTNINVGNGRPKPHGGGGQKWQPDSNRVRTSGAQGSATTLQSRGWDGGNTAAGRSSMTSAASPGAGAGRPGGSPASRPTPAVSQFSPASSRPAASPQAQQRPAASPPAQQRPATSNVQRDSAFGGAGNAANTRSYSNRGSVSRGGGGGGGGRRR